MIAGQRRRENQRAIAGQRNNGVHARFAGQNAFEIQGRDAGHRNNEAQKLLASQGIRKIHLMHAGHRGDEPRSCMEPRIYLRAIEAVKPRTMLRVQDTYGAQGWHASHGNNGAQEDTAPPAPPLGVEDG